MEKETSELITWSDTFACGIKLIDDQHKGLVSLVNDMFNHVTGDEKEEREYLDKVIQEAVKYIRVHFATEEKIMRATNFSGFLEHKNSHSLFIFTIIDNINDFNDGKRINLYNFTKYLKNWVLSHIAVMDKQYFEHLKKIAAVKRAQELNRKMPA